MLNTLTRLLLKVLLFCLIFLLFPCFPTQETAAHVGKGHEAWVNSALPTDVSLALAEDRGRQPVLTRTAVVLL